MARGASDLKPTDIALSGATGDAIHAAGKQVFVSHMLERSRTAMSGWANEETAEHIPLRLVPELEKLAIGQPGWPHVTRCLAKMQGFELFRLPEAEGESADWLAQAGKLSTEAADIIAKICTAMTDSRVCAHDVARLNMIEEAETLVGVAVGILARVRAVAGA